MILEVGVLAETAGTDVAFKRPGTGMDVHVRFQIAGRRERFGTQGTLVWLFLYKTM